jgi:HK97 family phage major capsid protein
VATDYQELVPRAAAREIIAAMEHESVVLRLANVTPVPTSDTSVPIVSLEPVAGFVAAGGRKPASAIEWSAEHLIAEEIATTLAIPDAFIEDTSFPVWDEVRPRVAAAIAKTFDAAVLWGTNAPATYPAGGIAALAGAAVTGVDALDALDVALGQVEATGVEPDGIAASLAILGVLRAAYRAQGALPGVVPEKSLYGLPVATTPDWPNAAEAIVGDWSKLLVGIRSDIRFELSQDGVLVDETGDILVTAFQDDMTLMRAWVRIGVAIGRPIQPDGVGLVEPFKLVEFTGVPAGAPAAATTSTASTASTSSKPRSSSRRRAAHK